MPRGTESVGNSPAPTAVTTIAKTGLRDRVTISKRIETMSSLRRRRPAAPCTTVPSCRCSRVSFKQYGVESKIEIETKPPTHPRIISKGQKRDKKDENTKQPRLEREPYLPIQEGTSSTLLVILVMKPGNCRSPVAPDCPLPFVLFVERTTEKAPPNSQRDLYIPLFLNGFSKAPPLEHITTSLYVSVGVVWKG